MENAGATTTAGEQPPPGWYPDPQGQTRWWDGSAWTAQTQSVTAYNAPAAPNRTLATVAHLGGLIGGWITPLIVYLIDGGKDPYVRHNAAEALNFQITEQIASLVLTIPAIICLFASLPAAGTRGGSPNGAFFGAFFLFIGMAMILRILNIVWSIMGMVRANKLEYWRYPVRFNFVKGSLPKEQLV